MIYIYVFLILILVTFLYMHLETRFLCVRKVSLCSKMSFDRKVKIVQLSDIHIGRMFVSQKKMKQALDRIQPDLIILTGDYFEKASEIETFLDFVDNVLQGRKTFVCFGNHDYQVMHQSNHFQLVQMEFQKRNLDILIDQTQHLKIHGYPFQLIGIDDIYQDPNVEHLFTNLDPQAYRIVFTHNPDMLLRIPANAIDLFLCGHFHGGQIWTPFHFEFRFLRKEAVIKLGFLSGYYDFHGMHVYLNRGLGNVALPLRFFSPPEMTVFEIESSS
jgi:predicted MPP superfamily phosphohydrolase